MNLEEWAREVRRRMADWAFIESQPPRLREALKYSVERGDLRWQPSWLDGVDELADVARQADIPTAP